MEVVLVIVVMIVAYVDAVDGDHGGTDNGNGNSTGDCMGGIFTVMIITIVTMRMVRVVIMGISDDGNGGGLHLYTITMVAV